MTDHEALICPDCHQGELVVAGEGLLGCTRCGQHFLGPERLCPFCGSEHDFNAGACAQCGQALRRTCPRCHTVNSIRAEACETCGLMFDTIGQIAAREERRQADPFTLHAETIGDVRSVDRAHVQQHSEQMWAQERQRLATLAAQRQAQRRQERQLMYAAIAFMVVVVVIIVVIAIGSAGG